MDRVESALSETLVRWVRFVTHHAGKSLALILVITALLTGFAAMHLGINSDNVELLSERLPARQNYLEFTRSFPNIENVLLVVIDGETPELARTATTRLQNRLREKPEFFREVYIPGAGEFFERNGLLYRDVEDLDEFSIQIAHVQPVLTALERDPTVANLASLIQRGLESAGEETSADDPLANFSLILERVGDATVQAYREFPLAISWEEILLRGSAVETVTRWVLVIDPVLDFGSLFAAADPMAEIRKAAADLELDPAHGVTLRITGNPALNYEEMLGILWDIGLGGALCFFFVIAVLMRALRSFRLVIAAVVTLLIGLVWTGAFASASVGSLNLISVAFAILFIGLGVDFTIHLGMAYADALRRGTLDDDAAADKAYAHAHPVALDEAIRKVGSSLVTCTATTATGFYVFMPTDNVGVAELGLIAGTGMIVNLFLTTTLFPVLLTTWCRLDPKRDVPRAMHFRSTWWRGLTDYPRTVASIALLLFALGAWKALDVPFDANVVRMRNPATESVQAFNDLLSEAGARSPWPMDTIAPNLEEAERLAREVEKLEVVDFATTLADYVPSDQEDKLAILEDVGMLLDAPQAASPKTASGGSTEEQIAALRSLRDYLKQPSVEESRSILASSMRSLRLRLDDFLLRIDGEENPAEAIEKLEKVLLGGLQGQLHQLRQSTFLEPIELEDLPHELRDRMMTADGRARVQIFPSEQLTEESAFTRFAREVGKVLPRATGLPMNMIAFADATRDSFREALTYAIILISIFLFVLWRRAAPVLLVLAPLLLSNVLTIGLMATFGIAFNFVNVVVIPLLLGIGVDSGVHLVYRAETLDREGKKDALLSSTTARAVFYSAITTTVSFGTLALSSHQGVASLGVVLTIGMTLTVISNLVVLPALLALRRSS